MVIPEDPAAVAARKEREFQWAVGLAVAMGIGLVGYAVKFVTDTRAALAFRRDRPRQPWEEGY